LTGGMKPSESTASSGAWPQTWQHSTGTLAPVPAARATFVGPKELVSNGETDAGIQR